jgi:hypothetical protein
MRTRTVVFSVIFYVGVSALLLGVLFEEWVKVLPRHFAGQIGHNTEGYLAALVIAAWIQFVRPRLSGKRSEWPITIVAALAFVGLTVAMLTTDWPSRFKTLNEGTLGAALMIPYVQLHRPLPGRVAMWAAIAVFAVTAVTIRTAATVDMAETYGIVFLGIIGLDVIDRGILDPEATTTPAKRYSWYALLILAPTLFSFLEYHWGVSWHGVGSSGPIGVPVRWLVRIVESFIFALFVEVFFAVLLGRTGIRPAREWQPPVQEPRASYETSDGRTVRR